MDNPPPSQTASVMNPIRTRMIWGVLVLVLLGIASAFVWNWFKEARRDMRRTLPILGQLSDFEFIERSGKSFGSKDLRGTVWIADFVFTRCGGPCPMMTLAMERLQNSLKNLEGVKLVSFSADPEYDTPEILREYARQYQADESRWLFLTGEMRAIQKLAHEGFKLSVEKASKEADPQNAVIHSTRFILMDGQGRIRGYYDYSDRESYSRILSDVAILLKESRT